MHAGWVTADPQTREAASRLRAENSTIVGAAVCALVGDLDLRTRSIAADALGRALSGRPPVLCVDLREVQFCDSAGLALLLSLRRRCEQPDGPALALVAPSHRVTRLLELTDSQGLFQIFPDSGSAVAGLRR